MPRWFRKLFRRKAATRPLNPKDDYTTSSTSLPPADYKVPPPTDVVDKTDDPNKTDYGRVPARDEAPAQPAAQVIYNPAAFANARYANYPSQGSMYMSRMNQLLVIPLLMAEAQVQPPGLSLPCYSFEAPPPPLYQPASSQFTPTFDQVIRLSEGRYRKPGLNCTYQTLWLWTRSSRRLTRLAVKRTGYL